jgi:hypothetical protein
VASKYDPLLDYLRQRGGRRLLMTFGEIERVLGFPLPEKSKRVRAWWSNNPNNNVMTAAWLAAGYRTEQVDIAGEALVFAPSNENAGFGEMAQAEFEKASSNTGGSAHPGGKPGPFPRSPLFGSMKGTTIVQPGVDLTAPSDPDWGKVYED